MQSRHLWITPHKHISNNNNNKNYKKKPKNPCFWCIQNFFPGVRPLALHAALSFYSCGRKDVKQDLECVLWSLVMSYSKMCQVELSTVFLETPLHRSQKDLDLSLAHFRLADFLKLKKIKRSNAASSTFGCFWYPAWPHNLCRVQSAGWPWSGPPVRLLLTFLPPVMTHSFNRRQIFQSPSKSGFCSCNIFLKCWLSLAC